MNKQFDIEGFSRLFSSTESSTLVVIPARSGSRRFPDKNIYPYQGTPLMIRSALSAKRMQCAPRVVISTDSSEYSRIATSYNIETIMRPKHLGCDSSPKQDCIIHAISELYTTSRYLPRYVISLQANSLGITTALLDNVFSSHYAEDTYVLKETVTIDQSGNQNGAIRIMNIASAFQPSLSTYLYTYIADLTDIHYPSDLK